MNNLQNFLLLFMSLLTVLIVKNSHILAGIYFIFLRKGPRPNFQYQTWTSVKRSGNQLSSKTNFSTFLKISSSNFRLKLCLKYQIYKYCQTNQTRSGVGRVRNKKLFPETMIHKIFEINSRCHVKYRTTAKVQFLFFRKFLLVQTESFDNSITRYPNSGRILLLSQLLLSFIFPCQHNNNYV